MVSRCRDLGLGTQLAQFKACGSPAGGVTPCGPDAFLAAQSAKDAVHTYAWHSEAVAQRSFVAEKLSCVAADRAGALVAAGGASGTLYVWQASSGRLAATVKAHTKAVARLRFSDAGTELFSGGEDALLKCWPLTALLDTAAGAAQPRWLGCGALFRCGLRTTGASGYSH
jgi:WD domain, G-beta repeat